MSYRGTTQFPQQELTSVKRVREAAKLEVKEGRRLREAAGRLPDGSGFATGTVYSKKEREARKMRAGGPGSGPRKKSMFPKGMNPAALRRRQQAEMAAEDKEDKALRKELGRGKVKDPSGSGRMVPAKHYDEG